MVQKFSRLFSAVRFIGYGCASQSVSIEIRCPQTSRIQYAAKRLTDGLR